MYCDRFWRVYKNNPWHSLRKIIPSNELFVKSLECITILQWRGECLFLQMGHMWLVLCFRAYTVNESTGFSSVGKQIILLVAGMRSYSMHLKSFLSKIWCITNRKNSVKTLPNSHIIWHIEHKPDNCGFFICYCCGCITLQLCSEIAFYRKWIKNKLEIL